MATPNPSWNAGLYDDKHSFVWEYGSSLVELLSPKPGERILDLGCGTGHLTAQIAQAGAVLVGLDRSEEMLRQARAAHPALEFQQGDARDFAFAEPFDAVFSNAVLHWVRPPEKAIRCVYNALRPGGRLIAELGGRHNVRRVLAAVRSAAERIGARADFPESYFPSIGEYAPLLEEAGFEVRLALLFDRPTPLAGTDGLRNWVKMFRSSVLESVPAERREAFLQAVEAAARPDLFRDGQWVADYRRLRIAAVRP